MLDEPAYIDPGPAYGAVSEDSRRRRNARDTIAEAQLELSLAAAGFLIAVQAAGVHPQMTEREFIGGIDDYAADLVSRDDWAALS